MAINYPYRVFRYQVEIDGISRAGFSEVSGMSSSVDAIEYREGDDLRNTPRKLPGLTKFGNVTLRWGRERRYGFPHLGLFRSSHQHRQPHRLGAA